MKITNKQNIFIVLGLIIIGAMSRLLPHPPNVTAMTGIALLGSAYIANKKLAIILPILVLFASDFLINNTIARGFFPDSEGLIFFESYMIYIYIAFLVVGLIGFTLRNKTNTTKLIGITLISTIAFFVISNLGVWAQGILYPKTISGLLACFTAAIPYFLNSVVGNLFFVTILFGSYHLINKKFSSEVMFAK